jgi:small subunit ribosomal protein S21
MLRSAARACGLQRLLLPRLSSEWVPHAAASLALPPPLAAAPLSLRGLHLCTSLLPTAAAAAAPAPPGACAGRARGITMNVEGGNVDRALRKMKRKMIEEGITKELKERQFFSKPSELRVRCVRESNPTRLTRRPCTSRLRSARRARSECRSGR